MSLYHRVRRWLALQRRLGKLPGPTITRWR